MVMNLEAGRLASMARSTALARPVAPVVPVAPAMVAPYLTANMPDLIMAPIPVVEPSNNRDTVFNLGKGERSKSRRTLREEAAGRVQPVAAVAEPVAPAVAPVAPVVVVPAARVPDIIFQGLNDAPVADRGPEYGVFKVGPIVDDPAYSLFDWVFGRVL